MVRSVAEYGGQFKQTKKYHSRDTFLFSPSGTATHIDAMSNMQ